jgi:hypothetical protein
MAGGIERTLLNPLLHESDHGRVRNHGIINRQDTAQQDSQKQSNYQNSIIPPALLLQWQVVFLHKHRAVLQKINLGQDYPKAPFKAKEN